MKKSLLVFTSCLLSVLLNANPHYMPTAWLGSLSFNEKNEWKIIISCNEQLIDSVKISSSTGESTYINKDLKNGIVITSDSLISKVSINADGDSINIQYFWGKPDDPYSEKFESIIFGNYKGSTIPKPKSGQCITRFLENNLGTNYHCLSDSLGRIGGTLKGHIYDLNNNLITNSSIVISPFDQRIPCSDAMGSYGIDGLDIDENGIYSALLYSIFYNISSISFCRKDSCMNGYYYSKIKTVKIKPLTFSMYPDSIIELDIHLLDDYVGIEKAENKPNELLQVFPNPLNNVSFRYEIGTPVKSTSCYVKLLNMNGQEIQKYRINENTGNLSLPANTANGTYILQLEMNNKTYSSTNLVVNIK